MSEPLTLAEAVPLGTVHLQRLLTCAGIRSLVIKGPAFVELGVRKPRQSNDIDLLISPGDREAAAESLTEAGWTSISHWFPAAVDDLIYSTTFSHPQFPASVDVHHYYSGVFGKSQAFEVMWARRASVQLANCEVETLSVPHALILEALNKFKASHRETWPSIARTVADSSSPLGSRDVVQAADELGARHSAAALISALGGSEPSGPPTREFDRWAKRSGQFRSRMYFWRIVLRAPHAIPRVLWEQITLREDLARFWAQAHNVPYRSRSQVLWLRLRGLLIGRRR
ncbi:nucleotidyltransferase family protein [Janibacter anophelis]|uniref:nucleotidyltransferase family protein n=1 Tax=Janibacter anophelis TaxID=319054 RepID=UPI000DEF0C2B|nr:nucleotidyltransferase family protein [Janibacter anophelis]